MHTSSGTDSYRDASMGPPFENGGGRRPRPRCYRLRRRFNGAAVRKRRRDRSLLAWSTRTWSGFNWAAVRKRRRARGAYRPASLRVAGASMGPPFENGGGSIQHVVDTAIAFILQWGRRSKTAEGDAGGLRGGCHPRDGNPLQWGRRSKRRRVTSVIQALVANPASMGPPFENGGGTTPHTRSNSKPSSASMGPPFENGGE